MFLNRKNIGGENYMEPELVGKRVKEIMKNNHMTIEEFAKKMGISQEVLEKKLAGKEEFYINEMHKIKEIFHLNLKEIDALFFQKALKK